MEAELQILEEFIKTNPDSRELKRAWEHPSFAMSKNTQAISPLR
ncbi:hypothetical protein [Microcystis sp. Msp_OC_L_20101000_S702]|jgi:hypothetical protein|nr:hypothetical protein [Microcystis sp. Msp_OC_L_20101000_S702]